MASWIIVSNILLWISVIVLSLMVYALVRQIGILYERVAPAGALAINKSLEVGAKAPELNVMETNTNSLLAIGSKTAKRSQMLFFVSPSCPVCKTLLPVAKSVAKAERDWLDVIFASDGNEKDIQNFIDDQKLTGFQFVNSELLGKSYGVSKLPYGVLIDEQGTVKSMGLINSREHFESLFNAKELGYTSLQEYMHKNYA